MYQCSNCHGYFDAGELRRGVCDECMAAEYQEEEQRDCNRKMLAMCIAEQRDGQMVMVG